MAEEHLFSIITVTYNAAGVIKPTLESVKEQSMDDYEMLVIDGASKDDTVAIAKSAGIADMVVVSEPDHGLYDAMNKGIRRAKGDYLIFLNAGDAFATASSLAEIACMSESLPGIIYGQTQIVNAERKVIGRRHLTAPKNLTADSFKRGMLVCHQAFIVRRDIAPQYDLKYRFSADYDWCIRCLKASPSNVYVGDEPIISYLNDGMTGDNHSASLHERFEIMCHNYGYIPTVLRHISFIPRYIRQKFRKNH
jgi:glycosyltransferase involved in cell wall biosynthesis